MRTVFYLVFAMLLLMGCTYTVDEYGLDKDFSGILKASGIDKGRFIEDIQRKLDGDLPLLERAELLLVLSRLDGKSETQVRMLDYYDRALEDTEDEEKALVYETIAALTGSKYYHLRAAWKWKMLEDDFRARIHLDFAEGKHPALEFDVRPLDIPDVSVDGDISSLVIGESSLTLTKDDLLLSQADRVTRDWLTAEVGSAFQDTILTVFSEKWNYREEDLREDIGWHEGAFVKQAKEAGLQYKIGAGTLVAKRDGVWYAPNEKGIFMFEVPEDKILYPTTRFFTDRLALIMDTHGINVLVAQALRENATAVVGCCDHPGKIKAVKYLSDRGVKVICQTDRFLPDLLGEDVQALGSAPFEVSDGNLVLGNRPLVIQFSEKIVVENATADDYGLFYYDTPARYFMNLEHKLGLQLQVIYVTIDGFNQTFRVIEAAEEAQAEVIALRVFDRSDYSALKEWLLKSREHRAVLFHSSAYPYGKLIFQEFTEQVSFDDINPRFEGQ
ncbi:hypothetical protein HY501_00905 [Candidatus Woesearchaeota archaeon]|nr:hypothetical protein [Candidatus Woesearchaeota archaeon]